MQFENPFYLLLLFLIPIFFLWYKKIGENQQGTLSIPSINLTSKKIRKSGTRKHNYLIIQQIMLLALIVIGISRPRLINEITETTTDVIDILLVLDISSSMLADDFTPNRLEAVKKTAIDFIRLRETDRIGIMVFAGESFLQCPLTMDKYILEKLINEISVASKEYDGTAIGIAIANGINRFRNSEVKSKVMILLSDGSNNSGEINPITAAELSKQFNVKIYTIGAGTNQSYTSIPGRGLIYNEIDEETLMKIAEVTGGKYFRATDVEALNLIYSEISNLERSEIDVKNYTKYSELYGFILIPAVFLSIIMEIFRRKTFKLST